jgi:hypothetical protein
VRQLAEYTIARHDADLVAAPGRFLALLERVAERQASADRAVDERRLHPAS